MSDIVNELRDRSYAFKAKDPLCERAADEIVNLRHRLMELAAQVRGADSLDEAVASANRIAPISVRGALELGFHLADMGWKRP